MNKMLAERPASKIPVRAKQRLQAVAGSRVPQLNLNQIETHSSGNQCPNQDEELQRTHCTEGTWAWGIERQKQKRENGEGWKDFCSFCHNSFDSCRPMKSYDCARNKNNHSSSGCERKINQAGWWDNRSWLSKNTGWWEVLSFVFIRQ